MDAWMDADTEAVKKRKQKRIKSIKSKNRFAKMVRLLSALTNRMTPKLIRPCVATASTLTSARMSMPSPLIRNAMDCVQAIAQRSKMNSWQSFQTKNKRKKTKGSLQSSVGLKT